MAINNFGGAAAASGGGGVSVSGGGSGYLAKVGDQYVAREMVGVYPIRAVNGDGRGGPLVISGAPQRIIASARIDGAVTTDQPFEVVGVEEFIPRAIVFAGASGVPDAAMKGGVYTLPGKAGRILAPETTGFAGLTGTRSILEVPVNLGESLRTAWFYVTLTTANPSPLQLDVYVLGDVLKYASA